MKRSLITSVNSSPFDKGFIEKKPKTRQDSQIESLFENLMAQCITKNLNTELLTRFISMQPKGPLLESLFERAIHCEVPNETISPLLSYTLCIIPRSHSIEDKKTLERMLKSSISKKLSDNMIYAIASKLIEKNLSTKELELISIDILELGAGHKKSNKLLIEHFLKKDPPLESISVLLECYLQKDAQNTLPYPLLTQSILELFLKKSPPLASLYHNLTLANEATNSTDLIPILLDSILEKAPPLNDLLILATLPKIQATPLELFKINKLLLTAFIQKSTHPELNTFSLDFFENLHPDLYNSIINWITRGEKGLIHTDDFKKPELCSDFVSSIVKILKFAQENEEYLAIFSLELCEALRSCKDQASLFANNLTLHKQVLESRGGSLEELLPIFKRKVAISALKEFSISYVAEKELLLRTNPDLVDNEEWIQAMTPDAVVIQLELECSLKRDLDLPGVISNQFFASELTASDKQDAINHVLDILDSPEELADWLIKKEELGSKSIWVQELLKQEELGLQAKIAREQEPLRALQNAAYEVNAGEPDSEGEWDLLFAALSFRKKKLFNTLLAELPTARLYEKRSHAILGLFESIENTITRNATIEFLINV